jgi:hypothetical protein
VNIQIKTIPHKKQRYDTVGDWHYDGNCMVITVSAMSDWRYEAMVAVHELVEAMLCEQDGVRQKSVDAFDIAFEKARLPGDVSEPGDDPAAIYQKQHCIATGMERIMAALLGVKWRQYEDEINRL